MSLSSLAIPFVQQNHALRHHRRLQADRTNGLARFAYGLLLPAMRADLDWNYTQAGWINTANAIGYPQRAAGYWHRKPSWKKRTPNAAPWHGGRLLRFG